FAGHLDPAAERFVFGKVLQYRSVYHGDIFRIARESRPAEGPFAFAEKRTDIGGHKARKCKGVFDAVVEGDLANVVAVVESNRPLFLEGEHGFNVNSYRLA